MTQAHRMVVIGGGTMGADVAIVFARGGWPVTVVEPGAARRASLPAYWQAELAETGHAADAAAIGCVESLDDVDWPAVAIVVDCAPERLDIKRALFAALVDRAPDAAILSSNSSSFPISSIGAGLATRHRMANLHFFMPAHRVPLVEVVSSAETAPETAETLMRTMRDLGRMPVHVRRDLPGFLANRMQHALAREAFALIDEGIATPEDVDAAVRFGFGFRYVAAGPALQRDHAGLDVHCAAAATMYPSLSAAHQPAHALADRVAEGRLGMKAGAGFYEWPDGEAASERARYHAALSEALGIIKADLPPIRRREGTA